MKDNVRVLLDLPAAWQRVLAHPWVETFDGEKPRANMIAPILGMVLAGLIAGLGASGVAIVFHDAPPDSWPGTVLNSLVTVPALFLAGSALFFVVARLLGGQGGFVEQTYFLSLAAAPLAALNGAVRDMPLIGTPLNILTWVYGAITATTALQAAHGYEAKHAFATWAIPLATFMGLTMCALMWEAAMR
jgi:hypothetical protein